MGGDSLDFYNLEGSDLNSATRQFFRVLIGENDKCFVKINQKKYSLVDVSINGVSINVNSGTEFPIGTLVAGCQLELNQELIKDLECKVVHNSSEPVNDDHNIGNRWLCGLIWNNLGSGKEELIVSNFEILKKDILVKNL
jgi:c-di-GMP-binding flagellar brake protein YcgR